MPDFLTGGMWLPYLFLLSWLIYAIFLLVQVRAHPERANPYRLAALPSGFTILGVFGTFIGIFFALQDFDVDNIDTSIGALLAGLKTAFLSSIFGIALAFLFARLVENAQRKLNGDKRVPRSSEATLLKEILEELKSQHRSTNEHFQRTQEFQQRLEVRFETTEGQLKLQGEARRRDTAQLLEFTRQTAEQQKQQFTDLNGWVEGVVNELQRSRTQTQEQL